MASRPAEAGALTALTADELEALRRAPLHPRDRALVEVLAGCGLRPAEICRLKLDDLDWHPERPPALRLSGRSGQPRRLPINAQVQDALRPWLEQRGSEQGEYLFCSLRSGQRLSTKAVWKALHRGGRRAGVAAVSPTRLRHTFGLSLAAAQVPLEQVFELLGSTSLQTARRYLAASDQQQQAAVERLDRRPAFWRWFSNQRHRGFRFWGRPVKAIRFQRGTTVGRQTELRQLETNLARGLDTLVLGPPGVGKSHLLGLLHGEHLVRLAGLNPPRQAVLALAEALHRQGVRLEQGSEEIADPPGPRSATAASPAPGTESPLAPAPALARPAPVRQGSLFEVEETAATAPALAATPVDQSSQPPAPSAEEFTAFLRRHGRLPLSGWVELILAAVAPQEWALVLDDLGELTGPAARLLDRLGTRFTVFAAGRQLPPKLACHFGRFDRLELGNLDSRDTARLIRQAAADAPVEDWRQLEAHLWEQTAGNPRAVLDLLTRLCKQPAVTRQVVRELRPLDSRRQIDLTPLVALPVLALIACRFLARGLGDTELYVFAGVGSVLAMAARFFLFRGR